MGGIARARRGIDAFRAMRGRDRLATLRAAALAVFVEVAVRRVRLPVLARWMGVPLALDPPVPAASPPPPYTPAEWRRTEAVRCVMRHWPSAGGTCLRESLLLGHVLRHRRPVLRVGARDAGGDASFHAWIEVDGTTSGDEQFVPLLAPGGSGAR